MKTRALEIIILPDHVELLGHYIMRPTYMTVNEWLRMWNRYDRDCNRIG